MISKVSAKDANTKKTNSPTKKDKRIHRAVNEPEMKYGSLKKVFGNIKTNNRISSLETIGAEFNDMDAADRNSALMELQRTHGNQYVQRVLDVQAKLKIIEPGDVYEQEADRVAEQVMRMPEPKCPGNKNCPLEYEKNKGLVQLKTNNSSKREVSAPDNLLGNLGSGQPIDSQTRAFMEPRFGHDFSNVNIYADSNAAQVAESINARAFTFGNKVIFGGGQHKFDTNDGKRLLAHELTHVVQQTKILSETQEIQNHHIVQRQISAKDQFPEEVKIFLDKVKKHPDQYEGLLVPLSFHPNPHQYLYNKMGPLTQESIDKLEDPTVILNKLLLELIKVVNKNPALSKKLGKEQKFLDMMNKELQKINHKQLEPYFIDALLLSNKSLLWQIGLDFAMNQLPPVYC